MKSGYGGETDELQDAYEHILFDDGWTPDSLAAARDIPLPRAAELVEQLIDLGLLRRSQEGPDRLVAVPPSVGMGSLLLRDEDVLRRQVERVHRLRETMVALVEKFEERRREETRDSIEVLNGRDMALGRIAELLRGVDHDVCTVVTSPPTSSGLGQARAGDAELLSRGVTVRAIYLEAHYRKSAPLRDYLGWLASQGSRIRLANDLPPRFMVFDQRTAVVAPCRDPAEGAAVVQLPGLVSLALMLFEALWGQAQEISPERTHTLREHHDFTETELTVLRILATGSKDETVSRRTGLSLRSVRRTVADLSQRLGANSRFELGLRCGDLGLIPPHGRSSSSLSTQRPPAEQRE